MKDGLNYRLKFRQEAVAYLLAQGDHKERIFHLCEQLSRQWNRPADFEENEFSGYIMDGYALIVFHDHPTSTLEIISISSADGLD